MKVWVSREANGLYMLTGLSPLRAEIAGTKEETLWVRPGDPIGFRGVCPWFVQHMWQIELAPLESVRVTMEGGTIGGAD